LFKSKKGITLIEVIITIGILGIVLTAIFSFMINGLNTFGIGTDRADSQFDVRMISDFVLKDVRNANEIYTSEPANSDEYYRIYLDDNIVKYYHPDGTTFNKSQNNINNINFTIQKNTNKYILIFEIKSELKTNNSFTLDSNVALNNIKEENTIINIGNQIFYKKPNPFDTDAEESDLD